MFCKIISLFYEELKTIIGDEIMKKIIVMILVCFVALTANAALFDGQTPAIAVMTETGMGYWHQLDANGNSIGSTQFAYGGNAGVAVGDIDGDGLVDFIRGGGSGANAWYEAKPAPDYGFGWVAASPPGGSVQRGFSIVDWDGDGMTDVFRVGSDNTLGWYKSDGTNNGLSWVQNWSGVNAVAAGNFDGDSSIDLFIIEQERIVWREATSPGVAGWVANIAYSGVKDIVVGNFDGDSNASMFIVRDDGTVEWRKANGDNSFGTSIAIFGEGITCVELSDINGNGYGELFLGRSSGGLLMYQSDGLNTLGDFVSLGFGNSAADLAIYNPIPEPTTLAIFGVGFSLMAARRRKNKAA